MAKGDASGEPVWGQRFGGADWVITGVDYSAGAALKDLHENLRKHAASLAFAHVNADLKANLDRLGLTELIGENRLFDKLRDCVAAYQAQ